MSKLKKLILKFKQLINEHPLVTCINKSRDSSEAFKMGLFIGGFATLIILLVMGILV